MRPAELASLIRQATPSPDPLVALGTIDEAYSSGRPRVRFDNEETTSTRTRPYLAGYTPAAGDRVLMIRPSPRAGWIVVDKVVTE